MKIRISLLLLVLTFSITSMFAQAADPNALWMEGMTPGTEHEFLQKMEGEWTCISTSYLEDGKTEVTEGKATKKMILGGRYLEEVLNSASLTSPFSGKNIFAYDNLTKKFRTFWIDNMGTGFMVGEGAREGNLITIIATYPDILGGPDQKYKIIYRAESDKKHSLEMYMISIDGQDVKQMEIVYNRAK